MKVFYKFTIIVLLALCFTSTYAQTVSYTYKPLKAEGCEMEYNVTRTDSIYYLIATVKSDRLLFIDNPKMKIRTFKDDVITIEGKEMGNGSKTSGIVAGNYGSTSTLIYSIAQFPLSQEQFEKLNDGVAKIRLSMTPMNHERTFKKDKIGKKLYKLYLKAKSESDF